MGLKITITKKKDYVYLVQLKGSLDTETAPQLQDELKEIINETTKAVMLDMRGVDYISSAGIGVTMWAKNMLERQKATFALINLQPAIKKVLDAMKVLGIIDIFDDMPEADKYIDQIIKEETEKQDI